MVQKELMGLMRKKQFDHFRHGVGCHRIVCIEQASVLRMGPCGAPEITPQTSSVIIIIRPLRNIYGVCGECTIFWIQPHSDQILE
jgi:hypothetical protein